jgi:hypothetical protein
MTPPTSHAEIQPISSISVDVPVDTPVDAITRNKTLALEVLLRLQTNLHMAASTQVERTTIITRTEEL